MIQVLTMLCVDKITLILCTVCTRCQLVARLTIWAQADYVGESFISDS